MQNPWILPSAPHQHSPEDDWDLDRVITVLDDMGELEHIEAIHFLVDMVTESYDVARELSSCSHLCAGCRYEAEKRLDQILKRM